MCLEFRSITLSGGMLMNCNSIISFYFPKMHFELYVIVLTLNVFIAQYFE